MNSNELIRARISAVLKSRYRILTPSGEQNAVLTGSLINREAFPAVGDYVECMPNSDGDSIITSILPRKSYLCRPDRGGHADGYVKTMQLQPIAANFDYAFIITSLNADFSVNRIARYASMVFSGGGTPVAILSKADLCPDKDSAVRAVRAIDENLAVHAISSVNGTGLDSLSAYLLPGRTIVLLGSSGAGKSTLINTLAGREIMRTAEIRESDSKGRHTTTARQLIDLNGCSIIDTPGLRELSVCDIEDGIDRTFSDIAELAGCCRFSNCAHKSEPGCAILAALREGRLSEERWNLYLRLQQENTWSARMKNQKMMEIAMKRHEINKCNPKSGKY